MSRRTYPANAFQTTLASAIVAGSSSIQLTSTSSLGATDYLIIDPFDPNNREVIKYDTLAGDIISNLTRGLAGSAGGTAQDHDAGAIVLSVPTSQVIGDLFSDIEDLEGEDTAHLAASDPHPNYLLSVNHSSAGDPHTQYLKEVDFNKLAIDNMNIDAGTLDGIDSTSFSLTSHIHSTAPHDHSTVYAPLSHVGSGGNAHADVTTSTDGFMTAADKTKLNGIATGATVNQTISAGTGLTGGGSGSSITLSHLDTSSQASVTNQTGAVVFNGITLDGFGHLTALSTRSLTAANIGAASTSHNHDGSYDAYGAAAAAFAASVSKTAGVLTVATLTLSTSKIVIRDLSGSVALSNGDGNRIIYGSGATGNLCYLGGIPFSPGAYQLECDEDGAYRRIKYDTLASSRRFKDDEQTHSVDPTQLRALAGFLRSFTYKADPNGTRRVNYIVEDVKDFLDPEAVRYDDEGLPLKFDANWMIAALIEGYIQLSNELDGLRTSLA